jgi:hypothetical protein
MIDSSQYLPLVAKQLVHYLCDTDTGVRKDISLLVRTIGGVQGIFFPLLCFSPAAIPLIGAAFRSHYRWL